MNARGEANGIGEHFKSVSSPPDLKWVAGRNCVNFAMGSDSDLERVGNGLVIYEIYENYRSTRLTRPNSFELKNEHK